MQTLLKLLNFGSEVVNGRPLRREASYPRARCVAVSTRSYALFVDDSYLILEHTHIVVRKLKVRVSLYM